MKQCTLDKIKQEEPFAKEVQRLAFECLDRFGSMNKNDYEVALFNLMLKCGYNTKSDFELSGIMGSVCIDLPQL